MFELHRGVIPMPCKKGMVHKPWKAEEVEIMKSLAGQKTREEVAIILGRSKNSVCQKGIKLGITFKKDPVFDPRCKVSFTQAKMIKCLYGGGFNPSEIHRALHLEVNKSAVWKIARDLSWKDMRQFVESIPNNQLELEF